MANEGIYRKTEKGRTEIATRANRLGLRERTMLIMVDDKTSRRELLSKNAHPTSEGILNSLLADGYIEIAPGAEAAGAASALAGPPAAPSAAPPPVAPTAPPAVQVEASLQSASRYACRTLVTLLGPGADDLTTLVEKCKGVEELSIRLEKCRDVIQAMAGRRKAEEFWAGVSARLPKA